MSPEAAELLTQLAPIPDIVVARARVFGNPESVEGAAAQGIPSPAALAHLGADRFAVWNELKLRACTWLILSPEATPEEKHKARIERAHTLALFGGDDTNMIDRAVADYTDALREAPDDRNVRHGRARLLKLRKDYDLALADHDELIRLEPTNAHWRAMRGGIHAEMKDLASAIADYTEAIRLSAADGNREWQRLCLRSRAQFHDQLGQTRMVIADLEAIVKLFPTDQVARGMLSDIRNGRRLTR